MIPDTHTTTETVPLAEDDERLLRGQLTTRARLFRHIALMPLTFFMNATLSSIPVGAMAMVIAGLEHLSGLKIFAHSATLVLLVVVWLGVAAIANVLVFRSTLSRYRRGVAANASLKADLDGGLKYCEMLRIEEALCVQENEHSALGYFCRISDGRVMFILDHDSACWEDEDLAKGYRRGVDPRQEHFVPADTLRVCRAPASGHVLKEEFSGQRVPVVEGIYWTDVTKLPEHGTFMDINWTTVLAQYKHDRVNWAEGVKRTDDESATA
jgi:hypothetical protein